MRIRTGRWVGALLVLAAGRGCYSSVAPIAKIDPGELDASEPVDPVIPDACARRRPWDPPGVTGLLPLDRTSALVLNGDRYFKAEFDTSGTDASAPTLGRVIAWRESGLLQDFWSDAPPYIGFKPWDDPGVTAAYITKGGTDRQVIISRFRRWLHEGDQWAAGSIVEDWLINDAGPGELDGQVPWGGAAGVTAAYFTPEGASFYAISQNKGWLRRTADPDPTNWTWSPAGGFPLATASPWSSAPAVAGQKPYDGPGVTAAYYVGPKFFVVSVDKMWVHDGKSWIASGPLKDMPGWASAPVASCGR